MRFRLAHIGDGLLNHTEAPDTGFALIRRKGNIEPRWLLLLAFVALFPLLMILARAYAMPGATGTTIFGLGFLHDFGASLNQSFTLQWVPPQDRSKIFYLLLLPLGAVLIALARLTFGLRILGFRSILIAIGFQQVGIIPSLCLIAVVVGTIAAIRPSMRRARLPLFARVSVILCVAALIMIGALMLAPIVRSEIVWAVAFFPVIIVAMLAEGIARTLAKDDLVTAVWRALWTLIVAFIFAGISMVPAVRFSVMQFPELMLTQLLSIVFIAEFLDLRLMEKWPQRLNRYFAREDLWWREKPRIAVVRNRWNRDVIGRLGRPARAQYRRRSVQPAVDGLRSEGFKVRVFEGDLGLPSALKKFIPPNTVTGQPGGLVLNLATGTQGNGQMAQLPALFELAGLAYTGPDPVAQALLHDRYAMLTALRSSGLKVPGFRLAMRPGKADNFSKLNYPLLVRSRFKPSRTRKVNSLDELNHAVQKLEKDIPHSALIEDDISGSDIRISILGNETLEVLPLLERVKGGEKICPAALSKRKALRIQEFAMRAYRIAGCRDYARIDLRIPKGSRKPIVWRVAWDNVLAQRGSMVRSAEVAGYTYPHLLRRITEEALLRYGLVADLRADVTEIEATDTGIDRDKQVLAQ